MDRTVARREVTSAPIDRSALVNLAILTLTAPFLLAAAFSSRTAVVAALVLLPSPYLYRLVHRKQLTRPAAANLPIALLALVLPASLLVSPAPWTITLPHVATLAWSIALYFAVINWPSPLGSGHKLRTRFNGPTRLYLLMGLLVSLAGLLGIPRVLIPRNPGVLSTVGLLNADIRNDYVRTRVWEGPAWPVEAIGATFAELADEAAGASGVAREANAGTVERSADLRYHGQGFDLTVDLPDGILDADAMDVERLISEAQADIDAELATDVLIIEDEAIISADIESLVRELGHRVTGTATTHDEAVDAVARHRPGLVLADIQLADGSSGIDAVKDILKRIDVPVIFITAFPERLLTGERPEPTFLITKPFQPETVKAAISQALFFHPSRQREAA